MCKKLDATATGLRGCRSLFQFLFLCTDLLSLTANQSDLSHQQATYSSCSLDLKTANKVCEILHKCRHPPTSTILARSVSGPLDCTCKKTNKKLKNSPTCSYNFPESNFLFCPTHSDKVKLQINTLKKMEHVHVSHIKKVIFFHSTN